MTTAFVLTGGGNLGAVQAGQLKALVAAGVQPDMIIGTSVGAINGAILAGGCDTDRCEALVQTWLGLRRNHVFPARPFAGFSGLVGRQRNVIDPKNLRSLLSANIAFARLEDAPIPFHVVACDLLSGEEVLLSNGDLVDAVCASAAIPGVFPPVTIGDHVLVDGGIANNAPISHAIELGADTIWVLPCGYACALPVAPRSAAGVALQALSLLIHQRLSVDILRYHDTVDLRVLPTLCPLNVSPTDFNQSGRLLADAFKATESWLHEGNPDITAAFGFPHRH